jgi:predicted house-cleaning noncanonical NTP pyrophosphatase (MazG superfamily)
MYLFYRNDERLQHNLHQLIRQSSKNNPVAIIKLQSTGKNNGKGHHSHFDGDLPTSALLCLQAKVALSGRNFCPLLDERILSENLKFSKVPKSKELAGLVEPIPKELDVNNFEKKTYLHVSNSQQKKILRKKKQG